MALESKAYLEKASDTIEEIKQGMKMELQYFAIERITDFFLVYFSTYVNSTFQLINR